MSDLDDAIRAHLELKRLHGADPTEVARLEQEALGGLSRTPAAALAAEPELHVHAVPEVYTAGSEHPRWRVEEDGVTRLAHIANGRAHAHLDGGEETQEFRIEDELGWADESADHVVSRRSA
jgi:hypothetical protein